MDIVEEIRADRERGAKRLEAEYRHGLMTLARRFCHDSGDAAELVNRTFAEVVANIDNYAEQSAFFGWMSKILVHLHSKDVRRMSHDGVVYPGTVPDIPEEDSEESVYRALDASLLRDAINTLPDDIRETLLLHYFMDLSVAKVAKILSVPDGTVKWRLHYAREILAAKMGVVAKKPGGKAVLLALLLCGLTALGAAVWNFATSGEAQNSAPAANAGQTAGDAQLADAYDLSTSQPFNFPTVFSQGENMNISKTTRAAAMLAAGTIALAAGGEYQYIVSGDPDVAAIAGSTSAESTTGALDVRHHSVAESSTMALTSIKGTGFFIVVR